MPIPCNPAPTAPLVAALSAPRLSNYRTFFGARDDHEALGLYQWNEEVSAAFFRIIALVEVVLRNRFHQALSLSYGSKGTQGSRNWYHHLQLGPASSQKISKIKRRKSPDDVVSQLTFGFWPHLLDVTHDTNNQPVHWSSIIPQVLPGHRQRQPGFWSQAQQDAFFARLELVNDLRNRVAHHEPIWKLGDLLAETRARHNRPRNPTAPAPATPADVLARLNLYYDRVLELLNWLCPATHASHLSTEHHARTRTLLTSRSVAHFRSRQPPSAVDVTYFGGGRRMRQLLRYAARKQLPLQLLDRGRPLGHWTCPS